MATEEDLSYVIEQSGNYFIMDSEQLVANPFQELQQDAASEAQKKNTMTERLTSVKNNVCENHFLMAKRRLERQKTKKLKQLHDHSNKLRHEVKLLDLDRQRHNVEIKKRLMPERDYSYDDSQIVNTEKRLGANIASFYLDKKMMYPTRLRSGSDISVTPTIRKARASIREQEIQKTLDDYVIASRQDRVATAKTSSSAQKLTSAAGAARRRDSRSAPAYTRNSRYGMNNSNSKPNSSTTTLPAIEQEASRRDAWTTKSITNNPQHQSQLHHQHQHQQQVKFVFENPLKILASSEESANLFAKSHPYYPGMVRAVNFNSDTSDDDDDEPYQSEVIDLRAILFGGTEGRAGSVPTSQHSLTHQQMAAIRKAQGPPPKLTTDMKQEESKYINTKINSFLETLAMSRVRTRRDSDDIFGDLDSDEINHDNRNSFAAKYNENSQSQSQPKYTSTSMTTNHKQDEDPSNTKSTSTADLPGQSQNKFQNSKSASNMNTSNNNEKDIFAMKSKTKNRGDSPATDASDDVAIPAPNTETPHNVKYSWRCIRGREPNGSLRGACSSEDLVLQALTGVPLSNMLSGHVPLHAASRAMRHTATFKMHKVVEKLIHERTKYERHQVEELKKQMETEQQQEQEGSSQPTRRISNSSITSRSSQLAAK